MHCSLILEPDLNAGTSGRADLDAVEQPILVFENFNPKP